MREFLSTSWSMIRHFFDALHFLLHKQTWQQVNLCSWPGLFECTPIGLHHTALVWVYFGAVFRLHMICSGLCLIHIGSQWGCPRAPHPDNCCRGSEDQTSASQWISFSPYFLNNRTKEGEKRRKERMRERGNSKVLRWHLLLVLSLPAVLKNPPHHTMHWPHSLFSHFPSAKWVQPWSIGTSGTHTPPADKEIWTPNMLIVNACNLHYWAFLSVSAAQAKCSYTTEKTRAGYSERDAEKTMSYGISLFPRSKISN